MIHGEKHLRKAKYCYNIIYNSIPYGLPGEKDQVKKTEPSLFATGIYDRRARESKSDLEKNSGRFIRKTENLPDAGIQKAILKEEPSKSV